jgi:O-antigen/teichoic acid export membrane protein
MMPPPIRANVVAAVAAVCANILLVFVSYRLVIAGGGLEALGAWSAIVACVSLLRIGDPGMASAVMRFVALGTADSTGRVSGYVQTAVLASAGAYIVLVGVGWLIVDANLERLVDAGFVVESRAALPILCAGFVLLGVSTVLLSALQGFHLGYRAAMLGVSGTTVQFAIAVWLVPHLGIAGLAWAQLAQHATITSLAWLAVRQPAGIGRLLPVEFSRRAFREMFRFGRSAQLASLLNGLLEPLSKILVGYVGGLSAQGVYELAYKTLWLPRHAIVTGVAAMTPGMTALYAGDRRRLVDLYRNATRLVALSVAAVALALVAVSPVLSAFWIGHFDSRFTLFLGLLSVGVIVNARAAPAYCLAAVTGRFGRTIAANTAAFAVLVMLSAMTIVTGAAAEMIVAGLSLAMIVGAVMVKRGNEALIAPGNDKGRASAMPPREKVVVDHATG